MHDDMESQASSGIRKCNYDILYPINTHTHMLQTALTEVKTKVMLEYRLTDKEKELSAVKQKLQEVLLMYMYM